MTQIVCPNCATSYEVLPSVLGASQRSVRCARCRMVWVAGAAVPAMATTAAPAEAEAAPGPDGPSAPEPAPDSVPLEQCAPSAPGTLALDAPPHPTDGEIEAPSIAAASAAEFETTGAQAAQASAEAEDPDADLHGLEQDALVFAPIADPPNAMVIVEAPLLSPATADMTAPAIEAAAADVTSCEASENAGTRRAGQRARQRRQRSRRSNFPTSVIVLLAMASVLVGWRKDVVRLMPQTASFFSTIGLDVNLRGLTFADLKTSRVRHDGVNVLVVEGKIVSQASKPVAVPRLRFAVRNQAGHEVYAWTALPTHALLSPGDVLPFRSRLASPPPDTGTVLVRFYDRRDMVAGAR